MPETKLDPAEAAAREVCNYTDEMRAWGESTPGEVSEVAAIIRRHMADRERVLVEAARNAIHHDPWDDPRETGRALTQLNRALAAYDKE